LRELGCDFCPNFKTATPNSGSDGDQQIFRICSIPLDHRLHGFWCDLMRHSSPAGVNGGNRAISRVGHQNRQAIGRADSQQNARPVRNERIAFAQTTAVIGFHDPIGVDLLERGKPRLVGPGGESRAELMFEPRKFFKVRGPVKVPAVETKQVLL